MRPATIKEAVFSGYTILPDDFKSFMRSMHEAIKKHHNLVDDDILDAHVIAFGSWKRRLRSKDKAKVPQLRCMSSS